MQTFEPERKKGVIFHTIVLIAILAIGSFVLWVAMTRAQGGLFVSLMILLLFIFIVLPFVGYRAFALLNASYSLERDGLRLKWGLRLEDIPLNTVEWVRLANESGFHLLLPPLTWEGAILGHSNVKDLGEVEFIASDAKKLVLIATSSKVLAISPKDSKAFVSAFQRILELGSLSPIPSRSARPAAFLRQVWQDRIAKALLPVNFLLTLLLAIYTGFMVATHNRIPLGFSPNGKPFEAGPSEQILLLPVMGVLVLITNVVMGLFFFRKEEARITSYLLWFGGVISPALLLLAVILLSSQP